MSSSAGAASFELSALKRLGIDTGRPWLILGKGPSFSRYNSEQFHDFSTLSLNHAVKNCRPDLAHFIDLDAFLACASEATAHARAVVMPWQPHVKNVATDKTLEQLFASVEPLAHLAREGRLFTYNLSTGSAPRLGEPIIRVTNFSAEAAINLLAAKGARKMRTLGVDGGKSYAGSFSSLVDQTLLSNGQTSFDTQFAEFARSTFTHNLDFGPADRQVPVRVFVGSTPEQELACKVLEFSIRRRASISVEVTPLHEVAPPHSTPSSLSNQPRTPFSFQRFQIPKLCNFQGRAIYVDSDMQVFRDIRELWFAEMKDSHVLAARDRFIQNRKPQFSVMLIDCEKAHWDIEKLIAELDSGALTYEGLMQDLAGTPHSRGLHRGWNCLEYFSRKQTRLLHYTDMPTQPWISLDHPLEYLWINELFDGLSLGHIDLDCVRNSVERGWVRPSLWEQILRGRSSEVSRKELRRIDAQYIPPWKALQTKSLAGSSRKKFSLGKLSISQNR